MWIKKQSRGISLLEVLAAIFVVAIGLLGVLAVIPFGALQVSRAYQAEYAANMLANAAEEITIRRMPNPDFWEPPQDTLDCTKLVWFEPYKVPHDHDYIAFIQRSGWEERMRGRDDLVFTAHRDRRPDFTGQDDRIESSGKYTWFFTYKPEVDWTKYLQQQLEQNDDLIAELDSIVEAALPEDPAADPFDSDALEDLLDDLRTEIEDALVLPTEETEDALDSMRGQLTANWQTIDTTDSDAPLGPVTVDVLAGHSRVPTDDVLAGHSRVPADDDDVSANDILITRSFSGGRIEFNNADFPTERLSETKYVLVTWKQKRDIPLNNVSVRVDGIPILEEDEMWDGLRKEAREIRVSADASLAPIKIDEPRSAWYRIVFVDSSDITVQGIVVQGDFPLPDGGDADVSEIQVYVPNGVLYHKRVVGVSVR